MNVMTSMPQVAATKTARAAAEIIVVERGQIVMNERIRVQHFERRAEILDAGGKRSGLGVGGCRGLDHPARLHTENWAQALAAGKHAVAHGLMDGLRMLVRRREKPFQSRVCGSATQFKNLFQHRPQYNNLQK